MDAAFKHLIGDNWSKNATFRFPEDEPDIENDRRVEAIVSIGDEAYAVEHTLIEPFEGYIKSDRLSKVAEDVMRQCLSDINFEFGVDVCLRSGWFKQFDGNSRRVAFAERMAELVRKKYHDTDNFRELVGDYQELGEVDGVYIRIERNFFEVDDGEREPCIRLVASSELKERRIKRLDRALSNKVPKLLNWSDYCNTMLILENPDLFLTGQQSVRPILEKKWPGSAVPVDFLFFICSGHKNWRLYPFIEKRSWAGLKPNGLVLSKKFHESGLAESLPP